MFFNAKALAIIVSCALAAQAQNATTTAPASQSSVPSGLDPCILSCVSAAAVSSGCGSFTNLTCVCTSTAFQQTALGCLQANCTPADLAAAAQLQQQQCAALNGSSSGSGSGSAAQSTAASTAASSATRSPSSSSAALALSAPFSLGGLLGTLVASAGALVGAAFIL